MTIISNTAYLDEMVMHAGLKGFKEPNYMYNLKLLKMYRFQCLSKFSLDFGSRKTLCSNLLLPNVAVTSKEILAFS